MLPNCENTRISAHQSPIILTLESFWRLDLNTSAAIVKQCYSEKEKSVNPLARANVKNTYVGSCYLIHRIVQEGYLECRSLSSTKSVRDME